MPSFTKDKPATPLPWHLTVLRHTDVIVVAATAVGVMHLRTSHAVIYSLGSTATSLSAKGLKKIIKQPRPEGSYNKRTHGMPSTHSSSITFMGLYLSLCFVLLPLHPSVPVPSALTNPSPASPSSSGSTNGLVSDLSVRLGYAAFAAMFPAVVIWSRIALGLHTPAQCGVGALLGAFNAVLLFTGWNGMRVWGVGEGTVPGFLLDGVGSTFGVWADVWIKALEEEVRARW
ncbi:unnamed protein product [Tilletia controversa]|uniref:Phosphatidic acid phosphatase type 2/haloperoxidase domain-containing protein n=2 Tax=Tilletia TaxID=13289 RepID=A0A8X7N1C4_9BASI|nr:hypothetical protein CF336_g666 [Tilletia laevis]KAE8206032.1 hypothetical protein CF328_g154 [Tilletia controversa]CAD6892457.1 unnamed protein product [Tilletia caries]KAE8208416.1 hypothetical protein CF335_g425 [Tilletia laevis]KAE8255417.1 hypothetical protein A4X06_0g431 [Tilletia controversa]